MASIPPVNGPALRAEEKRNGERRRAAIAPRQYVALLGALSTVRKQLK